MTGTEELQERNFCKDASLADFHYVSKNPVPEKRKSNPKQFFLEDYLIYALQNPQKNQNHVIQAWYDRKIFTKPFLLSLTKKSSY